MEFEPLPPDLEAGIERFADQQHISNGEALCKLVESGLATLQPGSRRTRSPIQSGVLAEALKKIEAVRAERAEQLARLSVRRESTGKLIGFLRDEPEILEAIQQASRAQREALYN